MAEHGAFAASGRAAGVEDGRWVVGLTLYRHLNIAVVTGAIEQRPGSVIVERQHITHTRHERQFAQPAHV
jgi:hypothetical protein